MSYTISYVYYVEYNVLYYNMEWYIEYVIIHFFFKLPGIFIEAFSYFQDSMYAAA
jgi:hypothetical protein